MKNKTNLQTEKTRDQATVELAHKDKINQVFLTIPDDEMYPEVLAILLEVMESKHGIFGYIDEQGTLVIPSLTREIWDDCQVPDKTILFPRTSWGGIWGRALLEKKSLYSNEKLKVPEGHLPINNVLVVPILYMEKTIGMIQVANKEAGFDEKDQELLEHLVNHIAPILEARLQRDVKEKERNRATEALRLQSEIAMNLSEGIYLIRMSDGIIVYTNSKFEEMFGYVSGEMVGKLVSTVNSPESKDPDETTKEIMEVLIKTGEWHGEVKNVKKDGTSFWCYANVSIFDHHEFGKVLVSVHTDISERKKAEDSLRESHRELELKVEARTKEVKESEERYRMLTESALDSIFLLDKQGEIQFVNTYAAKQFHSSKTDLIGKSIMELFPPGRAQKFRKLIDQVVETAEPIHSEEKVPFPQSERWLNTTLLPIRDNRGSVIQVLGISRDVTIYKEAEEDHNQFFNLALNMLCIAGTDGYFKRLNPTWQQVLGFSEEELMSKPFFDFIHPDDIEPTRDAVKQLSAQNPVINFENRYRCKNGSYKWLSWVSTPSGEKLYAAAHDITELKQAVDSLKTSEEKFRMAFDNAAIGKAIANLDGQFIKVSPAMCLMLGYDETELLTKTWMDITHPEFLDLSFQMSEKLMKGENPSIYFDCKFLHKNKTTVWINLNIVLARDTTGNPLFFIGDMVNITEQKRISEELNYRNEIVRKFLTVSDEEMFHAVLKITLDAMESPYGVFGYIDQKGDLIVPSMTRHIWDKCNVPEKDIVFPHDSWGDSTWPTAIKQKKSNFTNEKSTNTPAGHINITRHITVPILYQSRVIGLLQIANKETNYTSQDVELLEILAETIAPILAARLERNQEEECRTLAEKSLEEKVLELERSNKELEQFAYVASHDLQEPLRMVSSYTQLLEKRYKDKLDEDAHDFIGFAVDGANHMQRLINDLLDYSRVTTRGNPFKKLDLSSIMGQVIVNLQQKISETQAFIVNEELPFVKGDESQLIRLFQNLIDNAIKFKGEESPRITINAKTEDKSVTISVQDNGIGIDEVYSDRIFTIFQRLHTKDKYPGTGIGLAICKRIVERHGGTIWFESEEGKGTTFWFTLKR